MSASQTAEMLNGSGDRTCDVSVDMMDYSFINKCTNVKQLEKILRDLRSGKHGYYPHLINHCEDVILKLNPKSKALRKENPAIRTRDLPDDDRSDLTNGIQDWSSEMKEAEKDLTPATNDAEKSLPPIRTSKLIKGKAKPVEVNGHAKSSKDPRIRSWDYKAWDKFDADVECDKVEEKRKEIPKVTNKKVQISHTIDSSNMTQEEKAVRSSLEKDKGNEAFKCGDFEEAIAYYSRSINLIPVVASINNRALTYLRVEDWKNAEKDCNEVLSSEPDNLKAKLRRATALNELGCLEKAKLDLEDVLSKEANNVRAQKILDEVNKKLTDKATKKTGRRMVIDEVESSDEESSFVKENGVSDKKVKENGDSHTLPNDRETNSPAADTKSISSGNDGVRVEKTEIEHVTSNSTATKQDGNINGNSIKMEENFESKPCPADSIQSEETPKAVISSNTKSAPKSEPVSSNDIKNDDLLNKTTNIKQTSSAGQTDKLNQPNPVQKIANQTDNDEKPVNETVKKEEPPAPEQRPLPTKLEAIKQAANDLFRSGQYGLAAEKYAQAIGKLPVSPEYSNASALLHNNRAACKLKIGDNNACIEDCTRVLKLKPYDVKALVRRATAYEHKERYEQSYVDFKTAQLVDYNATQAQDGANRMAKHLRELYGGKWQEKLPEMPTVDAKHISVSQPVLKTTVIPVTVPQSAAKPKAKVIESEIKKSAPAVKPEKTEAKKTSPPKSKGKDKRRSRHGKSPHNKKVDKNAEKQAEEAAKKNKIRQDLFEKLKEEGNGLVRKGNYASAIESYTKCIQIAPDQVASFTNRALCFLKLNKHISADHDCSEALKLDPKNVKALFRRAQARKSLKLYNDAEADLKQLLAIDPCNKPALNEMKMVQKELVDLTDAKETLRKVETIKPEDYSSRKLIIEEISDEEEDSETNQEDKVAPNLPSQENSDKTPPASKEDQFEEEASQSPITTPYEFGHLWNAVQPKTNIQAYQRIINRVDLKNLPNLVSNKTDAHMITTLTQISRNHMSERSSQGVSRAYEIMKQMVNARRFNMAAMFLSKTEKSDLRKLFDDLSSQTDANTVGFSASDVNRLRKNYSV
uniref:Sperm-associated antigen 1 n=1 Tax=Phallusia mammillata TaxID=59560 RepID=A0A6F9DU13_9ASCI|nr:sperm-associated antigen 1 [Phallusia mammillata]